MNCATPWRQNGNRPLHRAAEGGHGEAARLLVQLGADPSLPNQVVHAPCPPSPALLPDNRAIMSRRPCPPHLPASIRAGSVSRGFIQHPRWQLMRGHKCHVRVDICVAAGSLTDSAERAGVPLAARARSRQGLVAPLHRAADNGHLEAARALLECKARVDAVDKVQPRPSARCPQPRPALPASISLRFRFQYHWVKQDEYIFVCPRGSVALEHTYPDRHSSQPCQILLQHLGESSPPPALTRPRFTRLDRGRTGSQRSEWPLAAADSRWPGCS